ncbi:helix-turn-helix domain-containing protein [Qipengyuania sp. DGS5-3]|uniref:helix-turn-helix domain-containing protein n=1 Tax=Qipengyuania sp. DGS5-3 TaxID=3349632 RepID=UPI0036D3C9C8
MIRLSHQAVLFLLAMASLVSIMPEQAGAQTGAETCSEALEPTNSLADLPAGQLKPLSTSYFLDPEGNVDAKNIAAKDFTFAPCQTVFDIPSRDGALWLRFEAANAHAEEQTWGVAFLETIVDEAALYEEVDGALVPVMRDGRIVPAEENENSSLKTAVSFVIAPGARQSYYIRVSGTYAPSLTPVISSARMLEDWSDIFTIISASLLGFCAIMIVFSLILFRRFDVRFYQYYTIYLFGMFCLTSLYDGWFIQSWGITVPIEHVRRVIEFASGLVMLANIQYCRILLTVDPDPRERRQLVFHVLTGIGLAATIWAVADPWEAGTPLPIVFLLCPFVLLFVSGRKALKGMKQAVPVFASLFALSLGLFSSLYFFLFPVEVVPTGSAFEVIMMRPITLSYASSTIAEGIFMMFAISSMINAIQEQRNLAVSETVRLRSEVERAKQQRNAELETIGSATAEAVEVMASRGFLDRATRAVIENIDHRGFGAGALASALGITEKTLGRRLKKSQGLAPAAFIRSIRLSYARDLILQRQFDTVAEIANASGFASSSHFAKLYREEFKEPPSKTLKTPAIA